jgi:hypothetical protein
VTIGLVAMSAGNCIVGAVAAARDASMSESTEMLWYLAFAILVTLWSKNDLASRGPDTAREYSYLLMFFFWPVVLPYHLVRTRGVEGAILFLGFLVIYMAPQIVQLYVWASRHAA